MGLEFFAFRLKQRVFRLMCLEHSRQTFDVLEKHHSLSLPLGSCHCVGSEVKVAHERRVNGVFRRWSFMIVGSMGNW